MGRQDQKIPRCVVTARVTYRSSRPGLADWRDGVLCVRVGSAPEAGKANKELSRLVAEAVGVSPSCVEVIAGASQRDKRLRIVGLSQHELEESLARLIDGDAW